MNALKPATPRPTSWLDLPQSVPEAVAKELISRSNAYPKLVEDRARLVAALRKVNLPFTEALLRALGET